MISILPRASLKRPSRVMSASSPMHSTWISPRYDSSQRDPEATRLPPSRDEQLLPEQVRFDDVAPGALRIVAVVSATPAHVSAIEALEAAGATSQAIMHRLPQAEVRELRVTVTGGKP
jgi:hypothetical protein